MIPISWPTTACGTLSGTRTPGIVKGADNTITVYIQPDAPTDPSERANWLPSPAHGNFHLTYGPKQPIIDQVW